MEKIEQQKRDEQEAKAFDEDLTLSWDDYAISHGIIREANEQAYDVAKLIFQAGYSYGTIFVSKSVAKKVKSLTDLIPPETKQ